MVNPAQFSTSILLGGLNVDFCNPHPLFSRVNSDIMYNISSCSLFYTCKPKW